jgi:ferredoxin
MAAVDQAKPDQAAAPTVAPAAKVFRIAFTKANRVIECPEDTFVLTAARRAGLRLPSSCTRGVCGTCKSQLVAGTVDLRHAGGIRQREIDAGMILLCCSKPTSDLVVDG